MVGSFWVSPDASLARLRNLLSNISLHSVIRIGGNSSDILHWISGSRGADSNVKNLYNSDIDKCFTFLSSVGWKGIYTVNLAQDSAHYAGNAVAENAAESGYVYSTYGSLLKSMSGNRIPTGCDVLQVRHALVIPANSVACGLTVVYDAGIRVQYGTNARLLLSL